MDAEPIMRPVSLIPIVLSCFLAVALSSRASAQTPPSCADLVLVDSALSCVDLASQETIGPQLTAIVDNQGRLLGTFSELLGENCGAQPLSRINYGDLSAGISAGVPIFHIDWQCLADGSSRSRQIGFHGAAFDAIAGAIYLDLHDELTDLRGFMRIGGFMTLEAALGFGAEPPTECSDGIDNDGDGRTDFPSDRQCKSADQTSERDPKR